MPWFSNYRVVHLRLLSSFSYAVVRFFQCWCPRCREVCRENVLAHWCLLLCLRRREIPVIALLKYSGGACCDSSQAAFLCMTRPTSSPALCTHSFCWVRSSLSRASRQARMWLSDAELLALHRISSLALRWPQLRRHWFLCELAVSGMCTSTC